MAVGAGIAPFSIADERQNIVAYGLDLDGVKRELSN